MPPPTLPHSLQPHLPPFEETDVAGWLTNAQRIYSKFGIQDNDLPLYLGSALPVSARPVHEANQGKPWPAYRDALTDAFKCNISYESVRQRLLALRRGADESLRAYAYRMQHAARIAPNISEADICRIFLQALPREDAQLIVSHRFSSLRDLVDTLEAAQIQRDLLGGLAEAHHVAPAAAEGSAARAPAGDSLAVLERFLERRKADQDAAAAETARMKKIENLLAAVSSTPAPQTAGAPAPSGAAQADGGLAAQLEKLVVAAVEEKSKHFSQQVNRGGGRGNGRRRGGNNFYYPPSNAWSQQPQQGSSFGYFPQPGPQWAPAPPAQAYRPPGPAPMGSVLPVNHPPRECSAVKLLPLNSRDSVPEPNWASLRLIPTPADGNCFYSALSYALYQSFNASACLRQLVQTYIMHNWVEFSPYILDQSPVEFYQFHIRPGVFAGMVHVEAAARMLRVPIFVRTPDMTHRFGPAHSALSGCDAVSLDFCPPYDNGHYQCLVSEKGRPGWPLLCLLRAEGFARPLALGDAVPDLPFPPLFPPPSPSPPRAGPAGAAAGRRPEALLPTPPGGPQASSPLLSARPAPARPSAGPGAARRGVAASGPAGRPTAPRGPADSGRVRPGVWYTVTRGGRRLESAPPAEAAAGCLPTGAPPAASPPLSPPLSHEESGARVDEVRDSPAPPPPVPLVVSIGSGYEEGPSHKLFPVEVSLDGLKLRGYLDTCASRTIVNERFCTNFQQLRPANVTIKVANKSEMQCRGVYNPILDFGKNFVVSHPVLVCDLSVDFILGDDFLSKFSANIDYGANSVTLHKGSQSVRLNRLPVVDAALPCNGVFLTETARLATIDINTVHSSNLKVYSKSPVILKANNLTMVPAYSSLRNVLPAVLTPKRLYDTDFLFSVECYISDKFLVPVFNFSADDFALPPNVPIGTLAFQDRNIPRSLVSSSLSLPEVHSALATGLVDLAADQCDQLDACAADVSSRPALPSLADSDLSEDEKLIAQEMLEKYSDVFGYELKSGSFVPNIFANLELKEPGNFFRKNWPWSLEQQKLAKTQVTKLLEQDVIQESYTNNCLPVFIILKRGSTIENPVGRLLLDCRVLNKKLHEYKFRQTTIDECLQYCADKSLLSVCDIVSYFYTIKLTDQSTDLLGFQVGNKRYKFLRLPFGLKTSPQIAQATMAHVLQGLDLVHYVDDIITGGLDFQNALSLFESTLQRFRSNNLIIRPDKTELFRKEIHILGMLVTAGKCVRPDPARFRPLLKLENPQNAKQLKCAIAFLGYHRRFIPNFSVRIRHLMQMSNEKVPFRFTEEDKLLIRSLYTHLLKSATLALFNPAFKTKLHTDGSKLGIGAFLTQCKNKYYLPIAYFSASVPESQKTRGAFYYESLALYESVKYFEKELMLLEKFIVVTDSTSLPKLTAQKSPKAPFDRFIAYLSQFNIEFEHVPSNRNNIPDALSRIPEPLLGQSVVLPDDLTTFFAISTSTVPLSPSATVFTPSNNAVLCPVMTRAMRTANNYSVPPTPSPPPPPPAVSLPPPSVSPSLPPPSVSPPPPPAPVLPAPQAVRAPIFEPVLYDPSELPIEKFTGQFSFLSRFFPCSISSEGILYPSLHHALQDHKNNNPDWDFEKFSILKHCIRDKFAFSSPLSEKLLATGNRFLNDKNENFSSFFGTPYAKSGYPTINILGYYLMERRSLLQLLTRDVTPLPPLPEVSSDIPSLKQLIRFQKEDPKLASIIQAISARQPSSESHLHNIPKFKLKNGLLVTNTSPPRTVVPAKLVPTVLQNFHDLTVHSGISLLQLSIAKFYFWFNMYSDIEQYVKSCTKCAQFKPSTQKLGLLHPRIARDVFTDVMVDFCHVFTNKRSFSHCLIICDLYSNHCSLFPCKSTGSDELIRHLYTFFSRFGVPQTLYSDVCSAVKSEEFQKFADQCRFKLQLAASGAHWSVGAVESNVKRFSSALKFLINNKLQRMKQWYSFVPFVEFHMNNSPQVATKLSPNEIIFGKRFNTPFMLLSVLQPNVALSRRLQVLYELRQYAEEAKSTSKAKFKGKYDVNRKTPHLSNNEKVFVLFERKASKSSPIKLQHRYRAGTIIKKLSDVLYLVRIKNKLRSWNRLCHVAHIKQFLPRPTHLSPPKEEILLSLLSMPGYEDV
ncbi:Retrovirus-related Pol polyprotein from transposon 412 [Frankliniella fusca]|uniref:RNA-directed DNA polymerase n=1 Tax=Frankliniella fusca TaxID=407009 RepID=A0AAE1HQR7_9NEOP|nr:Retrovirus-related Pol polyprotein from transposon 412 [Frankliniella fusca]